MAAKKIYYTDAEVAKLMDCEVLYNYTEWRTGHKFLKRGRKSVTVLAPYRKDQWMAISRSCFDVKINGVRLDYMSRYEFTNPKQPFKIQ
jgi:hypothetical protein